MGPSGTGEMTGAEFAEGRALASNDHAYFVRLVTEQTYVMREDNDATQDFYFGTAIRRRHTDNYVLTFEKILKAAREVDQDDMITNALLHGSTIGRQYRIIMYIQGEESYGFELST